MKTTISHNLPKRIILSNKPLLKLCYLTLLICSMLLIFSATTAFSQSADLSTDSSTGQVPNQAADQEIMAEPEASETESGDQFVNTDDKKNDNGKGEGEISVKTGDDAESKGPGSLDSRVDDYYEKTNAYVHGLVFKADDFLGDEQNEDLPTLRRSRFNFAFETKIESRNDDTKLSLDLDIRADVKLPKTQQRLGIFVSTSEPGELPGEDPDTNPILLGFEGISAFNRFPYLNVYAGVKVRFPPAFFTGITFRPHFEWDNFELIPQQKVFWFSDDTGLGGLTSLRMEWKPKARLLVRSLSAASYDETTDGIEYEQTFLFAYSTKGTFKNLDRGHGLRLSVFGHKAGSGIIDSYRITYLYRRPVYKKWLFIQFGPEARFYNEDDWDISPAFRVGFDMLFWVKEDLDDEERLHNKLNRG